MITPPGCGQGAECCIMRGFPPSFFSPLLTSCVSLLSSVILGKIQPLNQSCDFSCSPSHCSMQLCKGGRSYPAVVAGLCYTLDLVSPSHFASGPALNPEGK